MGTAAPGAPSDQDLIFFNARIALRENHATDVLKLWLLRNVLHQHGELGAHDDDFRSVVWAALGELALCQDGVTRDSEGGAGLWPLALHNYLVTSLSKGPPDPQSPPWGVFEVGRQQRMISLNDVLTAEELRSVSFFRSQCLLPRALLVQQNEVPWTDLEDRLTVGLMMRRELVEAKQTLDRNKVPSVAVIDARIFDLDLALASLQARKARRESREAGQRARSVGVSDTGAAEVRKKVAVWDADSKQAEFLRSALAWRPDEWLALSKQRRLSLFAQARPLAKDPDARDRLALQIIDALIEQKEGEELTEWIGFLDAKDARALRDAVTHGDRGARLLELEPSTGFRERSVVALHRGVAFLEAGQLQDALQSFAFVLNHGDESREAETSLALARRWLSYVLARFETNQQVLSTLKALVPKQELNAVLEDLLWRAAVRADSASFERVAATVQHGGALDARIDHLRPLANGKPGDMANALRAASAEEPASVIRFVRQLVESLESEDADVRRANIPTLKLLQTVLVPIAEGVEGQRKNSQTRAGEELLSRVQAILDGLDHLDLTDEGKAKSLSLHRETYAGAIRLAPSDPLPWPFRVPEPEAPSAFVPLKLRPVEWRDANGVLVFGWRITE